ncbi:hypothetical protein AMECASPLE_027836, partial [Ameca splendens]
GWSPEGSFPRPGLKRPPTPGQSVVQCDQESPLLVNVTRFRMQACASLEGEALL